MKFLRGQNKSRLYNRKLFHLIKSIRYLLLQVLARPGNLNLMNRFSLFSPLQVLAALLCAASTCSAQTGAPNHPANEKLDSNAIPFGQPPGLPALPGETNNQVDPAPLFFQPPPTTLSNAQLRAAWRELNDKIANQTAPVDQQNLALLKFKLEQVESALEILESGRALHPDELRNWTAWYFERAQTIASAPGDATATVPGPLHERAYLARNDGSTQPYWVAVPDDYSPQKKYPLVIFLHGYSPDTSKLSPWLPGEETWSLATARGFIIAIPYGRRNTDFVDVGEDDVLRVREETLKNYSIDENRVSLLGPSMGGFGVYAIGLHRPDLWAGLAPMSARSDFYLWFGLQRQNVPVWKRSQYDADDPRFLATNARHLPMFLQHGALDNITDVEQSRRMARTLAQEKLPFKYREIPEGDHYIYFYDKAYDQALDWLLPLKRTPAPVRVSYLSVNARNADAYWTHIETRSDYAQAATIDAEIVTGADGAKTIDITTKNVTSFRLDPPEELLAKNAPVAWKINGEKAEIARDEKGAFWWQRPAATATAFAPKSPQHCGPIKNCYRDPFLLVYGTQAKNDDDKIAAQTWAAQWRVYADGMPPIKADSEITQDDKQNFNLVLFGSRDSNRLLSEIVDQLPLGWTPTGVRVGVGKGSKYLRGEPGVPLGLQMCYASPWSPQKMIVVQSGAPWGEFLPINHRWDLQPDYIVFSARREPSDNTNQTLAAGFFTTDWKLPAE